MLDENWLTKTMKKTQRGWRRRVEHESFGTITPVYMDEGNELAFHEAMHPNATGSQLVRDIVAIGSSTHFQITGLLGYYSQRLVDLQNEDHRQLLRDLLFEPGALEKNLALDPHLGEAIIAFVNEGLSYGGTLGIRFKSYFGYLSRSLKCTLENLRIPTKSRWTHADAFGDMLRRLKDADNGESQAIQRKLIIINYYRR